MNHMVEYRRSTQAPPVSRPGRASQSPSGRRMAAVIARRRADRESVIAAARLEGGLLAMVAGGVPLRGGVPQAMPARTVSTPGSPPWARMSRRSR